MPLADLHLGEMTPQVLVGQIEEVETSGGMMVMALPARQGVVLATSTA